jgi:hypothetical protein
MEKHGKSWKNMEKHGNIWKNMENNGKSWENLMTSLEFLYYPRNTSHF